MKFLSALAWRERAEPAGVRLVHRLACPALAVRLRVPPLRPPGAYRIPVDPNLVAADQAFFPGAGLPSKPVEQISHGSARARIPTPASQSRRSLSWTTKRVGRCWHLESIPPAFRSTPLPHVCSSHRADTHRQALPHTLRSLPQSPYLSGNRRQRFSGKARRWFLQALPVEIPE